MRSYRAGIAPPPEKRARPELSQEREGNCEAEKIGVSYSAHDADLDLDTTKHFRPEGTRLLDGGELSRNGFLRTGHGPGSIHDRTRKGYHKRLKVSLVPC